MANTKITDEHTVTMFCGEALVEQIEEAFILPMRKWAETHVADNYDCGLEISLITKSTGESCQWCFLRFEDKRFFHLFTGSHADGSPRMETHEVSSADTDARRQKLQTKLNHMMKNADPNSWADDYEIEELKTELADLGEPQVVIVPCTEALLKPEILVVSGSECELEPEAARPGSSFTDRILNALTTCNVPSWITQDMVKDTFSKYATDPHTQYVHRGRSGISPDTYPMIDITKDRHGKSWLVVKYDPQTVDAYYAGVMNRKLRIQANGQETTLIFQHPRTQGWSYLQHTDTVWRQRTSRDSKSQSRPPRSARRSSDRSSSCSSDSDSMCISSSSDSFVSSSRTPSPNCYSLLDESE